MVSLTIYNIDASGRFTDLETLGNPFATPAAAIQAAGLLELNPRRTHYRVTNEDKQVVAEGRIHA